MLDGPRLPPASGRPAKSLVVFLHGYGANGDDLIEIGRLWASVLPDTAFASPHAPEQCPEAPPGGRQWFPLSLTDMHLIAEGVREATPGIDAFLDAELARYGLDDSALALVGFSQGAMMALQVGPRRVRRIAGIIAYSGMLAAPESLVETAADKPPILLVHGEADPVVPVIALHAAVSALGAAEFAVEWHVSPNLEHGIDQDGLQMGAGFLRRVLT